MRFFSVIHSISGEYIIRMIPTVLEKILPDKVTGALNLLRTDKLCELRLRSNKPVSVFYGGKYSYLSLNGTADFRERAITLTQEDINATLIKACNKSMYAVNDRICKGYLTLYGGIRIGIAGETVFEGSSIKTVKNFESLNIRIPHEVKGCAAEIEKHIRSPYGYYSTLIVSPPGAGKTTILRDIARIAASAGKIYNVLIADEREEIAAVYEGKSSLDVGFNSDIISGCTKEYAFMCGIRAMRPDIIITDELYGNEDCAAVSQAIGSGVCVIASVHANNHLQLAEKRNFSRLLEGKSFCRFVDVSQANGPGTVEGIFDENFDRIV